MTGRNQCPPFLPRESRNGFALVACMLMLTLLMVLGLGILSLSTIELRRSLRDDLAAEALRELKEGQTKPLDEILDERELP